MRFFHYDARSGLHRLLQDQADNREGATRVCQCLYCMNQVIPAEILAAFAATEVECIEALGDGNIHDTYKVTTKDKTIVLQKINTFVFKNPAAIDENLALVSDYLKLNHPDFQFPYPLTTQEATTIARDEAGVWWRALPLVAEAVSYNVVPSAQHAYAAAFIFADFSRRLAGIEVNKLQTTIPDFHNLTLREQQFTEALRTADVVRKEAARDTITAFQEFAWIGERFRALLKAQVYKTRIHHHDTKVNNVMFRPDTPEAVTIVDLDTIMPGYFYSDIGDLLMFGTSVFEDETDLTRVTIDTAKWQAILDGYRTGLAGELSEHEQEHLAFSGLIMCYMLGLRFLTDYLNGEVYFKARYPGQNLDKAKNRLKLLTEMCQLVGESK
jgi:hypothetical protein